MAEKAENFESGRKGTAEEGGWETFEVKSRGSLDAEAGRICDCVCECVQSDCF